MLCQDETVIFKLNQHMQNPLTTKQFLCKKSLYYLTLFNYFCILYSTFCENVFLLSKVGGMYGNSFSKNESRWAHTASKVESNN